jgi:cytochrome b subunit of formate dehydrogenase
MMTLFRIVSGLVTVTLLSAIAYDLRRRRKSWIEVRQFLRGQFKKALHGRQERRLDYLRRIVYGMSAIFFVLLGVTGFAPVLLFGDHLSGVLLIIHVTIAPLFALSLSALALLWAHRLRFEEPDWRFVLGLGRRKPPEAALLVRLALKVGFWLALCFSLPLMLTIILGLFPLFGTEGETALTRLHGYSALLLMTVALIEIHLTIAYVQHSTDHPVKEVET